MERKLEHQDYVDSSDKLHVHGRKRSRRPSLFVGSKKDFSKEEPEKQPLKPSVYRAIYAASDR